MSSTTQPGSVDELTALYRETIVAHAVKPVGLDADIDATHRHEVYNPLCGDRIEVSLRLAGDRIEAMAFTGEACAICLASASLMCQHQPGLTVAELESTHAWLTAALKDADQGESSHPELMPLLGVRAYPSRIRCALLPWEAGSTALGQPGAARPGV